MGEPVVGFHYTDDRTRSIYIDPKAQAIGRGLMTALASTLLINIFDSSRDGNKVLVHAGSDVEPGTYFLLDLTTRRLGRVIDSRENLNGEVLAPMQSVSIPADF